MSTLKIPLAACWLMAAVLQASMVGRHASGAEGVKVVISDREYRSFFGNRRIRLLIQSSESIYKVDFAGGKPGEMVLIEKAKLESRSNGVPLISPDGTRFVHRVNGKVYVAEFKAGAPQRTVIAEKGLHPRWWVHPKTGDEYITYVNRLPHDRKSAEKPRTFIRKITKGGCSPAEEAQVLVDGHALHSGRSPDGKTMYKGFHKLVQAELKPLAIKNALVRVIQRKRGCRAGSCSIGQDPDQSQLVAFVDRGIGYEPHDGDFNRQHLEMSSGPFRVDRATIPEWSTHGDVLTALLRDQSSGRTAVFAYRFSLTRWVRLLRVTKGSASEHTFAHLWVQQGELPPRPPLRLEKWERPLYEALKARGLARKRKAKQASFAMPSRGFRSTRKITQVDSAGVNGQLVLRVGSYDCFPINFADFEPADLLNLAQSLAREKDARSQAAVAYFAAIAAELEQARAAEKAEAHIQAAGAPGVRASREAAECRVNYDGPRILAVDPLPGTYEVVANRRQVRDALGGVPAKLLIADQGKVHLIDLAAENPKVVHLFTAKKTKGHEGPFISPDGTRLVYADGEDVCVCELKPKGPGRTVIGKGCDPRWWIHPKSGEEYVIWTDKGFSQNDDISGRTYIRKVKKGTCGPDGPTRVLMDKFAFRGGRSLDGKYICTALPGFAIAELKPEAVENAYLKMIHSGARMCNPSMSQDPKRMMWWLWEDRGHAVIRYFVTPEERGRSICIPYGANQVQACEWSTHPDFITAYVYVSLGAGSKATGGRVGIYQWSSGKWIIVAKQSRHGPHSRSHLWVDSNAKPKPLVRTEEDRTIATWDKRLLAATRAALVGRKRVAFSMHSRYPHSARAISVDDKGTLKLWIGRSKTVVPVTGMSLTDKRNLARALASGGNRENQALAGFYTLIDASWARGRSKARVEAHLALAGPHKAQVLGDLKKTLAALSRPGGQHVTSGPESPPGNGTRSTEPTPRPPARTPDPGSAARNPKWPTSRKGLLLSWENAGKRVVANDGSGKPLFETHYSLTPKGLALYGSVNEMRLEGGAFFARKVGPSFIRSMGRTRAFSLQLWMRASTHKLQREGTIMAFSSAKSGTSFALIQKGDTLACRVGSLKKFELCRLTGVRLRQVVLTCKPGELMAYVDGRQVLRKAIVKAGPASWKTGDLVFGNTAQMNRPWKGRIEGVAIHSRALAAGEIATDHAAYARKLKIRKAPEKIRVRARMTAASGIGNHKESTYPMAYAVNEWEVEKVLKGNLKARRVRVAHWVWLDKKLVKMAGAKPGSVQELVLEPLESFENMRGAARRYESLDPDFDVPLFLDVRAPQYIDKPKDDNKRSG
jgi:Concanavalin A-like lectin/glucanases superfamily/WD40-like Beta Propeller Repeat